MSQRFVVRKWLYATTFLFIVGGGGYWLRDHLRGDHSHHQQGSAPTYLVLDEGSKWATDEPLRIGMQRIRDMAESSASTGSHRRIASEQAKQLGAGVQEQVVFLINTCRLEPKADAVLHVLISDLLKGAALLEADATADEGFVIILHALELYPLYFEHAHWMPVTGTPGRD